MLLCAGAGERALPRRDAEEEVRYTPSSSSSSGISYMREAVGMKRSLRKEGGAVEASICATHRPTKWMTLASAPSQPLWALSACP